jgi:hypothetical protein
MSKRILVVEDQLALHRRRGDRIAAICCGALCLLLAQSGHPDPLTQCPLLGVKRT